MTQLRNRQPAWLPRARELRGQGLSYYQISRQVGATLRSVCYHLSAAHGRGPAPEPRGEPAAVKRHVGPMGRVVLPQTVRDQLGLAPGERLEFWVDGDALVMRRHQPACTFCGSQTGLATVLARAVCADCRQQLAVNS